MTDTILLALLILGFALFLLYAIIKGHKLSKKRALLTSGVFIIATITLFSYVGFNKINSDISRIIHNSSRKSPIAIYIVLFKKPLDGCINVVNLKDQVLPKIDCCIWMELNLCPQELARIIGLKKYKMSTFSRSDSLSFLQPFDDKPKWWLPQNLGDTLLSLSIKFDKENQQTIFFASDSSHVFICDQAL